MAALNRSNIGSISVLAMLCLALLTACNGVPRVADGERTVDPSALLAGAPILQGRPMPKLPEADLLAMTPEMKAFVDFYVDASAPPAQRLLQLQSAIIHNPNFRLNYTGHTFTAADTFKYGYGNCLSFTNLFIAMSRYLGLKARYQEVEIPPSWDQRGGTIIMNRHINIFVRTDMAGRGLGRTTQVVDFNTTDAEDEYLVKRIADRRAEAHYYSNIGIDYLQRGNYLSAFLYMRKGLLVDPTFHDLWVNLGALYSRVERLDYAEQAYLQALRIDRSMIGLSNLARIYEAMEQPEMAARYQGEVARFRARNPYFRYQMAQSSLGEGDVEQAIDHLQSAIKLKPGEDAFYFLLGAAYLQTGDLEQAQRHWLEAQQLSKDAQTRHRYGTKLDKLLQIQQDSESAS